MQRPQEGYRSMGGKRRILVVDDEEINREMLGMILSGDYEVLYAEDGEKALKICGEQKESLSLVLLDLMMPVISGMEVLRRMKGDPVLRVIPVIVITADQEAETRSLGEGAIDFIPKPYPQKDVILARVRRIIELTEDREMGDGVVFGGIKPLGRGNSTRIILLSKKRWIGTDVAVTGASRPILCFFCGDFFILNPF